MKTKTKLLVCYLAILLSSIQYLFSNITFVLAASANHLVISEVSVNGNEFVELYNPTLTKVDLMGWVLQYKSDTGSDTSWTSKVGSGLTIGSEIQGFGFFLLASKDFSGGTVEPDYRHTSNWGLSNSAGHVRILNSSGIEVDKVGYGTTANSPESQSTVVPGSGQSIERKASATSTQITMIITGSEADKGNGEDSNNNSDDFLLRAVPEPQNSSSPTEVSADYIFTYDPPAVEIGGNRTAFKDTSVNFGPAICSGGSGLILSYLWNFGDGSTEIATNCSEVSHTFVTSKDFIVSLTITDNDGETATDSLVVSVVEMPTYSDKILVNEFLPAPGNTIDWDNSGTADSNDEWIELINLDDVQVDLGGWTLDDIESGGSSAYTIPVGTKIDADGLVVFYKKDTGITLNNNGDDVILKDPNGIVVDQVTFTNAVTDKSFSLSSNSVDGSWVTNFAPSPGRLNVPPANSPPNANAGTSITNAKTGEAVNFNGSASSDSDGSIVSYEWNFGDGATGFGAQTTHTYSTAGSYQVTLTVRDNIGATSSASINVSVIQGVVSYQNQYSSGIKIISIMPNPDGTEPDSEFIKVSNTGSIDINLRNWILDDEEGGSKPFTIDYDLVLKAGDSISFYGSDTKISLNNDGDSARLFDPDKKLVSSVSYNDKAAKGVPYIYENDKWSWQGGETINQENKKATNQENSKITEPVLKPAVTIAPSITAITPKESAVSQPVANENSEVASLSTIITQEVSAYEPIIFSEEKPAAKLTTVNETQKTTPSSTADFTNRPQSQKDYPKPYQNPYLVVPLMMVFCGVVLKFIIPSIGLKNSLLNFFESREKADSIEDLFK